MRTRIPITANEILHALKACEWDVAAAAQLLDVNERTLYRRMAEFGIRRSHRYEPSKDAA